MSFTNKVTDLPVAVVNGGQSDGEIVYLVDESDEKASKIIKHKPQKIVELEDGKFQVLPRQGIRVLYICGSSGSGKSTFASNYVKEYLDLYPKTKVFIFSQLSEDPAFKNIKAHRVTLDESLITEPVDIEDIPRGSIILFDDCSDCEDDLQTAINRLETQLLVLGRKLELQVIITSHLINPDSSKHIRNRLNEAQALVFFPQSGSVSQATYNLKKHFGYSTRQIQNIMDIDSRWIMCTKTYPNILISEHKITLAREI
jgi:hypothetical protein